MAATTDPSPRRWTKRKGDQYRAVFGDVWGNAASWTIEYRWLGPVRFSHGRARSDGFEAQVSDDFNIGVIRKGQLIATLWMDDLVDDDPEVMAQIVTSAGG